MDAPKGLAVPPPSLVFPVGAAKLVSLDPLPNPLPKPEVDANPPRLPNPGRLDEVNGEAVLDDPDEGAPKLVRLPFSICGEERAAKGEAGDSGDAFEVLVVEPRTPKGDVDDFARAANPDDANADGEVCLWVFSISLSRG